MTKLRPALLLLNFALIVAILPSAPLYAQGSIAGEVLSAGSEVPGIQNLLFFGYLRGTDNEIRLFSSDGAGYDAGFWFDDFQNFLDEAPGVSYSYHFHDTAFGEYIHLTESVPNNSFQIEHIQLVASAFPGSPTGLTAIRQSESSIAVAWQTVSGCSYHVYRRDASSNGSFFRIDDPSGTLDAGVNGASFTDISAPDDRLYDYVLICHDGSGALSSPSQVVTNSVSSSCCVGLAGNIDADPLDAVDIVDLTRLIDYLFISYEPLICPEEGNIDGDELGAIDIVDLTQLIDYLFISYTPPKACR